MTTTAHNEHFDQALASVRQTLERARMGTDKEREELVRDVAALQAMEQKLSRGQIEIAVFGEISTGKSALINALVGQVVASVDVQGGWTKEVWKVDWNGCGYRVPGLGDSQVVLVDTPGLNEVNGGNRTLMAEEAAQRADLILFVTDSDLNEIEYAALVALAHINKPIIVVVSKKDLYTPEQRGRLLQVLRDERLPRVIDPENIIPVAADPREIEYIVESADGTTRSGWRKPPPDVAALKVRILEVLEREGLALLALNAAMYAADKTDRVAAVRVRLRNEAANRIVWRYAVVKALAVAGNPIPIADTAGGAAADAAMVYHLGKVYGLETWSWAHALELAKSIGVSAIGVTSVDIATQVILWSVKGLSLGAMTPYTAVPQGLLSGWGSYIVGQAAKVYFEQGASWGAASAKPVIAKILAKTDKQSVLSRLKDEIGAKLQRNVHGKGRGLRDEGRGARDEGRKEKSNV
jgi:small GTP-binding protein